MSKRLVGDLLRLLPRDMQPRKDLWSSIEERLPAAGSTPAHKRCREPVHVAAWLLPAVAALVIGLLLVVVAVAGGRWPANRLEALVREAPEGERQLLITMNEQARRYEEAKVDLLETLAVLAELYGDHEAVHDIEAHLGDVDEIVNELRRLVRAEPSRIELIQELATLYGAQTRVLEETGEFVGEFVN